MDVILTGRFLSADEALRAGLVARVVAREAWLDEAKRVARGDRGEEPGLGEAGEGVRGRRRSSRRSPPASSSSGARSTSRARPRTRPKA